MTTGTLSSRALHSAALRSAPVFACAGAAGARTDSYRQKIHLGRPGRCPEVPVLCILLFDNSGSVTGGADPIGKRFLEAEVAITRIGRRCRCGRCQAAVLHFDTPTSGDLKPTPITRGHHEEIKQSLAIPPDGAGASMLGPSLIAASTLAARYEKSHQLVLVALTDFMLFDNHLDRLVEFPGKVHAVSLGWEPPEVLSKDTSVTTTCVRNDSPPGAVSGAIFAAMAESRTGAQIG